MILGPGITRNPLVTKHTFLTENKQKTKAFPYKVLNVETKEEGQKIVKAKIHAHRTQKL